VSEGPETVFKFTPIGIIYTPFKEREGTPIQGHYAPEVEGRVEVFEEFADGLKDVEGFSHIILLYVFHKSKGYNLVTKPFLEDEEHGVFAMRAPRRPNPIGLTVVRLNRREGNILHISGIDVLDGTPLLDIKPYVGEFDYFDEVRAGWLETHAGRPRRRHADDRFGK